MEFKNEELIEREIEIAGLLIQQVSLNHISETTGLSSKLVTAHIKNMMQKLKANDMATLKKILKTRIIRKIIKRLGNSNIFHLIVKNLL